MMQIGRVLFFLVCVLLCLSVNSNAAISQAALETWGVESMTQLRTDFRLSSGLYAQSLTERFPSYVWGQGAMALSCVTCY
jgi:hypothetical protein